MKRKLEGEKKPSDTLKKGSRLPQYGEREGWTQEKTAEDLNISQPAVSKAIQIANAIEEYPELAKKRNVRLAILIFQYWNFANLTNFQY
jgi:transcriptional regulator with XRE-family HTH domain